MGTLIFFCDRGHSSKLVSTKMVFFLVSTKLKHVEYFLFDWHVFLLKLVEMPSGNTYFRWILMIFPLFPLSFSLP